MMHPLAVTGPITWGQGVIISCLLAAILGILVGRGR